MGLFGGLVKTWSDGYQFGDILKSALYDLNPIAWAGDALVQSLSGNKDFDLFNNNPNWTPSSEDPIDQGIINTWNKFTGNAHLTPEYQHAEEREDSVNQRTANDMMLAGLSKYGFGGTSAGTSSAANGLTLLDAIGKAQQIKAQALTLKEMKYNLGVSKRLGIRTGDKNSLGQITSIAKALFGLDLSDIPEEGIIPAIVKAFRGSDGDGSFIGATADAGGHVASTGAKADSSADPRTLTDKELQKALDSQGSSVGLSQEQMNSAVKEGLEKGGVDTTPPSFESNPSSYGVFSNDFKSDAKSLISTLIKDKKVSTSNLDFLADFLSKRYNLKIEDVRKYLTDLVRELR